KSSSFARNFGDIQNRGARGGWGTVGLIRSAEACGFAGPAEDRVGHARRDPARERVLLARVVAAEQQQRRVTGPGDADLRAMPEGGTGPRHRVAALREDRPERLPGEAAEADDDPQRADRQAELGGEPGRAGTALARGRLVLRRRAAHRGDHARADQPLAVPGGDA